MNPEINEFNTRHTDLTTERGYQFEFHCMKCGRGKCSTIAPRKIGFASKLLGVFAAQSQPQAADPREKQEAFDRAVAEVKPQFHSCSTCSRWLCENCFGGQSPKCPDCVGKERVAPAAAKAPEPAPLRSDRSAPTPTQTPTPVAPVLPKLMTCPHCGAKAQTGKSCNKCANSLEVARRCKKCSFVVPAGKKFCLRCGSAQ
jgi:hypothetical protein